MKEKINEFAVWWKTDKLWGSLAVCWIAALFSASPGLVLFPITLPGAGTIFLFRLLLPAATLLYLLYALREKEHIWRDAPAVERWCYILIASMIACSLISLPRALDFMLTFRRLFNLCFDLCLFFLALRMWRYERLRRPALLAFAAGLALALAFGLYQMVTPGEFHEITNHFPTFFFFNFVFQSIDITQGNPNDYAAAFSFAAAIFLLWWTAHWSDAGKRTHRMAAASLVLVYFLTVANGARLVKVSFWILFFGLTTFLLLSDRRRLWIPLAVFVAVGCIWFANQYHYIVPSVETYLSQLDEYHHHSEETAPPPKFQITSPPSETLTEEFYKIDEETGEKVLRDEGSGGIRTRLLYHAFTCFQESRALGVGLGNTEVLAPRRNIVPGWADMPANSIHCFIARAAADYGLFFLIPLFAAALLLLKRVWALMAAAVRARDFSAAGLPIFYLCVLLVFPISSTASSDAQDILSMWLYLAAVAIFAGAGSARSNG